MPDVDAVLTMTPPPCATITGSTCLQPRKTLFRLRSIWASHTSSLISTGPPGAEPPTLLSSTSIRPNRLWHASTMARTAALSVTSQPCVATVPPVSRIRSKVSAIAAASLSTANTLAPSSANSTAAARPLPQPGPTEPAPVITATLPSSLPAMRSSPRSDVKPSRIVDQDAAAGRLVGHEFRQEIDQIAVVGHGTHIGGRPVRAPQHAVRCGGDEGARERHHVVVRPRGVRTDAVGAGNLDPGIRTFQQLEKGLKRRLADAR